MLQTDRLLLRPYTLEDYNPYLAMCSDEEVVRYLGGQVLSPEDAWNRVLRYAGHWSLLGYGVFAVFELATKKYIGETGICDFHRGLGRSFDQAGEAAWVFSRQSRGRGFAFEAANAAHNWFYQLKGESRTVCLIHPENQSSFRLADKLGYREFGKATYKDSSVVMLERCPD